MATAVAGGGRAAGSAGGGGGGASARARAPSVLRPWAIDHAPVSAALPTAARLAINSAYFDTLLSLIPPKYYLRTEEDDDDAGGGGGSKFHVKKKGAGADGAEGSYKASTKAAKKLRYTQGA